MPKYVVVSSQFSLGDPGDVVELDDVPGLNLRALLKSGVVTVEPDKPKHKFKKSADAVEEGED